MPQRLVVLFCVWNHNVLRKIVAELLGLFKNGLRHTAVH